MEEPKKEVVVPVVKHIIKKELNRPNKKVCKKKGRK